jgi:hypothetical protein
MLCVEVIATAYDNDETIEGHYMKWFLSNKL